MIFPDEFFEDEVKNGFFVDGLMKCCWAAQIEILELIDRICRKHHMQYFAEWGTMLGTVRHGGFIPWDDDFDIGMKRADFEKFMTVVYDELPDGYEVLNYRNRDDYDDVMTRIVNSMQIKLDDDFLDTFHNCPYICGLDIFPFDYVARDPEVLEKQKELVEYVYGVGAAVGTVDMRPAELEEHLRKIERLCHRKIDRKGRIRKQVYDIVSELYALFGEEESDRIALMQQYIDYGGSVYQKEWYAEFIRMPFEVTSIPVPIGYNDILRCKYRNYMNGVRKGGAHDYPFYSPQIEHILREGGSVNSYQYDDSKLSLQKNYSFRRNQAERIRSASSLQQKIPFLISNHQNDVIMNILQVCQTVAIEVGEAIEKRTGESPVCVTYLEKYCEALFQVTQMVQNGTIGDGREAISILNELLDVILAEIEAMPLKKEVVLLPWKAKHWERLQVVWEQLVQEPDVHVTVIPIPYQYKKRMGRILTEEKYEGDLFPADIPIVSYTDYDVEQMHPDEIYIVTPFDGWGHTTTLPMKYYAGNLWQHTECLTYIPWHNPEVVIPEDERGLKSLKNLVPMPGIVWADKVFVSSEDVKSNYLDCLVEWAGEETRDLWEEKIKVWAKPFAEVKKTDGEVANPVKKLLYFVSNYNLLEQRQNMIEKIRRNLDIFEQNHEKVHVLWIQEAFLEENLSDRMPEIWTEYKRILDDCAQKEYMQIIETSDGFKAAKEADAYYGDTGRWEMVMLDQRKPVMLQNVEC